MLFTPNAFIAALTDPDAATDCLPHGRCVRRHDVSADTSAEHAPTAVAMQAASTASNWRPRTMHEWLT